MGTAMTEICAHLKTACQKLFSVWRSMFLRFAAPAGTGRQRRRAMQDHAVAAVQVPNKGTADAGTLHAVTIRSRAAATGADSKDSASLMTEIITAPHALTETLGDHPLAYLWCYKYDSQYEGIAVHADEAAVNLNIWLTPEEREEETSDESPPQELSLIHI